MKKWFYKQNKLVQLLLLLIPITGWVIEIVVRWQEWFKKKNILNLILAILSIPGLGALFGWIDIFCILLFNKFFLTKK